MLGIDKALGSNEISVPMQDDLVFTAAPISHLTVAKWHGNQSAPVNDCVAEEVPIAIIYNGISHAVMLATAQDLEDFALGFSLAEGILQSQHELYDVEIKHQDNGIALHCEISAERFNGLKERRRSLVGRTGCGLCGAESLEKALRLPPESDNLVSEIANNGPLINSSAIYAAYLAIAEQQVLQMATGATHASAWMCNEGKVQLIREDVGRHNALDKLVGAMHKRQVAGLNSELSTALNAGFVLTTSRASYEMVQKVASAGVSILVAISAPTGLAVRMAEQYGITLVGFLRKKQLVVYTHHQRILHDSISQS